MDIQNTVLKHYAILIGINTYPDKPLKGCVQDVQNIKKYLEGAVNPVQIQIFTTADSGGAHSPSLPVDPMPRPTYNNVISALERVKNQANTGDYVYIHFSGHGTRGNPYGEFSNKSTGDLALVLLDGREESKVKCLWGPILAFWLNAMVNKGLVLTLVLDCCFSASVYRRDDNVRFVSYDAENDTRFPQDALDFERHLKLGTGTPASRDASMRLNWLIKPDGYAILAACGPDQEAREFETEDKKKHGALSYFLHRILNEPGGLGRQHRDIYKHLCAGFERSSVEQSPALYGNKDQGFFGPVSFQSDTTLIPIIKKQNGSLQLQAGQAHGICNGDRFALFPFTCTDPDSSLKENTAVSKVTHTRALTSNLELVGTTFIHIQTGWLAKPLTRFSLHKFPIRLAANLPSRDELLASLKERSLDAHIDTKGNPSCFHVILNSEKEYEILDQFDQRIVNLPAMPQAQTDVYRISDTIEHLAKFKLVKELTNEAQTPSFRESFNVRIIDVSGNIHNPGSLVNVQECEAFHLEVENKGAKELYVHVYCLDPFQEVQNIYCGSYEVIPPRHDSENFLGMMKKALKTGVPYEMKKKHRWCEDILKVFITSQPTSFDLLELPKLGDLAKRNETSTTSRDGGNLEPEDWAALNFMVHTYIT
ncbi:uncharacterized protein K441DRAFT_654680 [Cenococcum geophilum 1.58]|uniref:uncharacterized protein n=1 Tax=Cenococcum geophilum 1.58 TaxID=794803 RepID=UPI00358EAC73|nr:hypothetical protein K441DRAFT_654680 [Cenococcum geophilum 1.58]